MTPEQRILELEAQLKEEREEKEILLDVIKGTCGLLGFLTPEGKVKPSIMNGEVTSIIGDIINSFGSLALLSQKANMPGAYGVKKKEELTSKVRFFFKIGPLIQKYTNQ